ncbi:MAG: copper resistance protein NlpE [Saprospiraceae bacterium]|nr:copper resistance protein NlpE [Saprospiraceae bacterium]
MKNILLLSLVALIGLVSCKPKDAATEATTQAADSTMPTPPGYANVSAELAGMYKGILPCADCEGIETVLVLNTDNTFLLKTTYLGKPEGAPNEQTGAMRWNTEERFIVLAGISNTPNKYLVGENKLTQLDMNGTQITGDLADKYILAKQ